MFNRSVSLNFTVYILIISTIISACGNQNDTSYANEENSLKDETQVQQDNIAVDKNLGAYTYMVDPSDVVVPVVEAENAGDNKDKAAKADDNRKSKAAKRLEEPELEAIESANGEEPQVALDLFLLLKDIEINRPPVYGTNCLTAEYPIKCSSDNVSAFIKDNLDYPSEAAKYGDDGLEIVTFQVTKEGAVKNIKVKSKENPCAGCAMAAKKVVEALPDKWAPALRNGQPTNVTVTLPIRFEMKQ